MTPEKESELFATLAAIGQSLAALMARTDQLMVRMDQLTVRIDQLTVRTDQLTARIDHLSETVDEGFKLHGERIARLEGRIEEQSRLLIALVPQKVAAVGGRP